MFCEIKMESDGNLCLKRGLEMEIWCLFNTKQPGSRIQTYNLTRLILLPQGNSLPPSSSKWNFNVLVLCERG